MLRESEDARVTDYQDAHDTFLKADQMLESVSKYRSF